VIQMKTKLMQVFLAALPTAIVLATVATKRIG